MSGATTTTLTVLGSADTFNAGGRAHASYLVQDAHGAYCVDFGPTSLWALKARGFSPNDLDAVFLTHLHGDHFGGLQQLFIDAVYGSPRRRSLTIGGPVGTAKKVEAWFRLAYGGKTAGKRAYATRYLEWAPGESSRVAGRQVQTFRAAHMKPRDGALCLRIESGSTVLAFSGDTGWTDPLVELARGADLFVCECTEDRAGLPTHLSWEELAPRFPLLEARRILLSHLGESMRKQQKKRSAPRVQFADDGLVLKLR
ncbi:MAG: MBL fold metallo-hydrolase [Myxococcales bacterium]